MSMTAQRWWDAAMITVSVLLTFVVAFLKQPVDARELSMVAVVGVVLVAYFAWGRRAIHENGSVRGLLYAGLLLVSLAVGIGLDPNFSFMQVVIFPTLWGVSGSMRQAVTLNLLAIIPVTVGYGLYFGPEGMPSGFAVGVLSVGFSLAIGAWISGVERSGEERSRLLDELLAVQDQLAAANREAGIDSERGRLAREIHDTIAQSLTGLVMVAQRAHADLERASDAAGTSTSEHLVRATADVELIESMARDALTEARGLVAAISPVRVESTLVDALGRLTHRFERETGVVVRTDLAGLSAAGTGSSLSPELEVVLLRCAQEALANVRKHAQAQTATLVIAQTDGTVALIVTDDGVGPPLGLGDEGAPTLASGFGLVGMNDRLALVGGTVRLDAAHPTGSTLTVTIPVTPAVASAPAVEPFAVEPLAAEPLAETARIDEIGPLNTNTRSLGEEKGAENGAEKKETTT